jgi:SprT protein
MSDFNKQIRRWIDKACDDNGVPELKYKIDFEFNAAFTRRLGDAVYKPRTKRGLIRLSTPLWSRATETDQRETVIHEACHVIVGYKFGNVQAHGKHWQQAMHNCGIEAERTHNLDRTGLARKQVRWIVSECPNSKKCTVNQKDFNGVLKAGNTLKCGTCGIIVDYHSVEEPD